MRFKIKHQGKDTPTRLKKTDKNLYEFVEPVKKQPTTFEQYHKDTLGNLKKNDIQIYNLVNEEYNRQQNTIQLVAAANECSQAVLAAIGSVVQNKTAEGFPGKRWHGASEVVDKIEKLAIERAKQVFNAQYANVQPHSGSQANQIVFTAILNQGDTILNLPTKQGGHPSHGEKTTFADKFFNVVNYNVEKDTYLFDYEKIRKKAIKVKPKLIICGASAYSGKIDFAKFRQIADEAGSFLLADISHLTAFVMTGLHQNPIDYAHFTTTSTYKAGGPRGGLILMGKDYNKKITVDGEEKQFWQCIEHMTFPGLQGTAYHNSIAAKAVFFKEALCEQYKARQLKVIENAAQLAKELSKLGFNILAGGTNNHMILVNVADFKNGLTGFTAQKCLEKCGITVDKYWLAYDDKSEEITSGLRLGTPIVTKRAMGEKQMRQLAELMSEILKKIEIINDKEYKIDEAFRKTVKLKTENLCRQFCI